MATGYFLLDNPVSHKPKWYTSRRSPLRLIVLHVTAGLEDVDYTDDQSAEATARYAANTDRKVSWHSGSDADSHLNLLPASYTAFHCAGANSFSYGHEISKKHVKWAGMDPEWVARTLTHTALALGPVVKDYGIPLIRQSKAAVEAGARGFAYHSDLDPTRRSDPGADLPLTRLFDLLRTPAAPKKARKRMEFLYKVPPGHVDSGKTFVASGLTKRYVDDTAELGWMEKAKDDDGNLIWGAVRTDVPLQLHTSLKLIRAA